VSGGGYIGTSLSAAMTRSKGRFPFQSSLTQDEPYSVQHIRNHSNYLFPRGSINVFYNVAIYLRGLLANALLLLPWLLFAAAITIFIKPTRRSAPASHFSAVMSLKRWLRSVQLDADIIVFVCSVVAGMGPVALARSERLGRGNRIALDQGVSPASHILLIIGFCELQPSS
jgi:hypothetical protein